MIAELDRGKLPDQFKFSEGSGSKKYLLLLKLWRTVGKEDEEDETKKIVIQV